MFRTLRRHLVSEVGTSTAVLLYHYSLWIMQRCECIHNLAADKLDNSARWNVLTNALLCIMRKTLIWAWNCSQALTSQTWGLSANLSSKQAIETRLIARSEGSYPGVYSYIFYLKIRKLLHNLAHFLQSLDLYRAGSINVRETRTPWCKCDKWCAREYSCP